ncbi:VTT domain-containing protein [Gallaecimonas kandeliae]|uniref:VTT domain-containing protein n=1 Tax=Gallaecimonas kandeliae TaxID=3029055 RepID=UPI002648FBD3|nr:VTT domain-containing protein [Gallaecimonas kandeliae]WKE64557.1 VTT domain-containing protein [Gallaecimonas kandeliae]
MRDLEHLLVQQGPLLVFLNVLAEQLGLPLPSFPSLILVGALAAQGHIDAGQCLALAMLACMLADSSWNLAGRRFGGGLLKTICRLSLSQDSCIRTGLNLYARVGPKALLVSRFLPGAGALFTTMAGLHRTPWPRFWLFSFSGALLWAGTGIGLGLAFSSAVDRLLDWLSHYGPLGLLAVLGALALFLAWKYTKRRALLRRTAKVPRISAEALQELHLAGQAPLVLDVRGPSPDQPDGIPGALPVSLEAPLDQVLDQAKGRPVVVYCACPHELSAALLAEKLQAHGIESQALAGGLEAWQQLAQD